MNVQTKIEIMHECQDALTKKESLETKELDRTLYTEVVKIEDVRKWLKGEVHRSNSTAQILEEFDKVMKCVNKVE